MDDAARPKLTDSEWSAVSVALDAASQCGCVTMRSSPGGLTSRLGRALLGRRNRPNLPVDPKLEAIQRFVCATSRRRRPASELAPGLVAQGFNHAQIDAIALLSI
ncbi:hypothetical protein [Sphingomonas sp. R86521]|uniref:hypothetical protein n=1 Tax=Sphingomonas sp. R86521 TaxID=3093860 RepID=UPI0036D230E2